MPVDPSISLGIKPIQLPNALEMALQGANLRNAQLSGQNLQQTMGARQAIGEAYQRNTDPNGNVNLPQVQAQMATDPRAAYGIADATSTNQAQQQGQTTVNTGHLELARKQVDNAIETLGTLAAKPDLGTPDVVMSMAQTVKRGLMKKEDMSRMLASPDFPTMDASTDAVKKYIAAHLARATGASQQLANMTPQVSMQPTIGPNGQPVNIPTNVNPNAGPIAPIPGATPQPMTLSPSSLETIEQDAFGNKHVVSRSAQGAILSTRPLPGSAPVGTPGAFPSVAPGQGADIADAQKEVGSVRAAGDSAPIAANINREILNLSKDTTTAPGSERWQKAISGLSLGHAGDSYQELGKFLEKNAISAMQTMGGPPSDARLSAATAANGSTQFNPGALQAVTKFNDATTTALAQYRQGVDKAVGLKNSDYTALPTFKANWAKNFDVDIFRVENAVRDGDKTELTKLAKDLGPAKMKELAQKRLNLQMLTQTGRLP